MSNVVRLSRGAERVRLVSSGLEGFVPLSSLTDDQKEVVHARNEYQRGFREGRESAREEFLEEMEARILSERTEIQSLVATLQAQYASFQKRAERSAIELAVGIAESILRRELASDRQIVLRQIHEALKRVLGVDRIKLRVNPADEQFVRDQRMGILGESDSIREMIVEADEGIGRGGCIVESESGNVDAQLPTQLRKIEEALLEEAGSAS